MKYIQKLPKYKKVINMEDKKHEDDKIKKLETERLILRQIRLEDAPSVFNNWASDDEVTKYVRWSTHKNIGETLEYIIHSQIECEGPNNYEWGIIIKETNELIGAIGAFPSEDDRIEIGYNIGRKYWRNGYTTEALKKVLDYLSTERGIHHFICSHAVENPASGSVMKKAGFKYVKDGTAEKFDGSKKFDLKVYYLDI